MNLPRYMVNLGFFSSLTRDLTYHSLLTDIRVANVLLIRIVQMRQRVAIERWPLWIIPHAIADVSSFRIDIEAALVALTELRLSSPAYVVLAREAVDGDLGDVEDDPVVVALAFEPAASVLVGWRIRDSPGWTVGQQAVVVVSEEMEVCCCEGDETCAAVKRRGEDGREAHD